MVDIVSACLKILGWIELIGGIIGGIYIASTLGPSCDTTYLGSVDCTDPGGLQAAFVIGGLAGGLISALLFWALAFLLDMVEEIWIESGGHLPHAVGDLRTAPEVGGEGVRCPSCGAAIPPDATFCEECGRTIGDLGQISWPPSLTQRE
jgi:hypothetical protein